VTYLESIRLLAYWSVTHPDRDYHIRRVHRWYSKTFSTPLHEVYQLPLDDVLRVYFEELYESMDDPQREEELGVLAESEAEKVARLKRESAEEAADYDFWKLAEEEAKAEEEEEETVRPQKPRWLEDEVVQPDVQFEFQDPTGSMIPKIRSLGSFDEG